MADLQCEHISYPSADGKHTIAAYLYTVPDVPVRAVIQLVHGMTEYVGRYEHVAKFYAEHGIAFAGNDHLGHGHSIAEGETRGHYGEKDGRLNVLKDIHTFNGMLRERFAGLPLILYGHSMGSFYARWYAEVWPETISALIISGTAGPSLTNFAGARVLSVLAKTMGETAVSQKVVHLVHGKPKPGEDPNGWLTRDTAWRDELLSDGMGGFTFTVGTYREMVKVLDHVSSKRWAQHIPKKLPILLIAGDQDPVGNCGKGVRDVWQLLGDAGIEDLTCQIWEGGRHEMHNETNRDEVFDYCLGWIEDHIGKEQA